MTIDDFVELANQQAAVTAASKVLVYGPQLRELLAAGKPMLLSDIYAHPDKTYEIRQFRYKHILEPGVSATELAAWIENHADHPLPEDLIDLVKRVNGIHLWGEISEKQAYFGILPISSWSDAGDVEWAGLFDSRPVGLLVLSYHQNGDFYLVLDTKIGVYYWYDLEDFDNPKLVARNLSELLDWYWSESSELDPRSHSS